MIFLNVFEKLIFLTKLAVDDYEKQCQQIYIDRKYKKKKVLETVGVMATFVKNTFSPVDVLIFVKYENSFFPMFLTFQEDSL